MDKASGHHNGVRSRAQHSDVRALYAEAALHKAVWACTNPRSEHWDRHLAEGRAAENQLIAVPARNQAEYVNTWPIFSCSYALRLCADRLGWRKPVLPNQAHK